jgi:hypothetical protein
VGKSSGKPWVTAAQPPPARRTDSHYPDTIHMSDTVDTLGGWTGSPRFHTLYHYWS